MLARKQLVNPQSTDAKLPRSPTTQALNSILGTTTDSLEPLTPKSRERCTESLTTILARNTSMSGKTTQQPTRANSPILRKCNKLLNTDKFRNGEDARFIYQFAREATSAGVIPAFRDEKTGDIYIALVCNQRNLEMYNWSGGYTEAPLPAWNDRLLSESKKEMYYDRVKIKGSAAKIMTEELNKTDGDWTKVQYAHNTFAQGFQTDKVDLPNIDMNSLHTASRECLEEISLDLEQFPQKRTFLISYDNTLGISQGDAPGQISNRNHQYMIYLGEFDTKPKIEPRDDVAIADWVNVSAIKRQNMTEYVANEKPLSVYMLRGLEYGLKKLWHELLRQNSLVKSRYSDARLPRFSTPENVAAEIELFCNQHKINIQNTKVEYFLQYITGNLPSKTYTGEAAQTILNCLLATAGYLMGAELKPETFVETMNKLLSPIESLSSDSDFNLPPPLVSSSGEPSSSSSSCSP